MRARPPTDDRPRDPAHERSGAARVIPRPVADPADSVHAWMQDLSTWFAAMRRDLPWRRDRDPYRVWISETMLQQTRVEAVIPYFERFLARFPTVADLARAPVEEVLAAWSGLGYYRRARALHAAATGVVERHGGVFPSTRAELLALPGVGPYTAGAIASIAFDRAEPLVDGNVARVLARIYSLDAPQESAAFRAASWTIAGDLVARLGERSPGAWNQALMELGALVCVPRDPRCPSCPVRDRCRARAEGSVDRLPVPKRRPAAIDVELHVALVREGDRVWIVQRPPGGRMQGLWELPTVEPSGAGLLAPSEWPRDGEDGARIALDDELGEVAHSITRHRIRARVFAARRIATAIAAGDGRSAVDVRGAPDVRAARTFATADEIARLGLTGLTAKILRAEFARRTAR